VRVRREMLAAADALRRESLLGFDTETRPSFRKGQSYPTSLLQLAGRHEVYVFQLGILGLPAELRGLLSDPRMVKAGVAIQRDLRELRALADFEPRRFVDLGACAMRGGLHHHGLRGLAALLLGKRISKGARTTNWARPDIPAKALRYAATDAWVSRLIHEALEREGLIREIPEASAAARRSRRARLWRHARSAAARIYRAARGPRHE